MSILKFQDEIIFNALTFGQCFMTNAVNCSNSLCSPSRSVIVTSRTNEPQVLKNFRISGCVSASKSCEAIAAVEQPTLTPVFSLQPLNNTCENSDGVVVRNGLVSLRR